MKKAIRRCIAILIVLMIAMPLTSCSKKEQEIDKSMTVEATVIEIEKYGHAVLDITTADFTAIGYELGDVVSVRFGSGEFTMPFYDGYYSNPGSPLLRGIASEDYIAVCINYGDFSDLTT